MHVTEWSLAADHRGIAHGYRIREPETVAKRHDQWLVLDSLEHDGGCIDTWCVRSNDVRNAEPSPSMDNGARGSKPACTESSIARSGTLLAIGP